MSRNDRKIRGGNAMKTLKELKVGQTATVVRLHGEGPVRRRIMDMGLTKGTQVYLRKVAPLGDPLELTVRNYELSIRKADAAMVEVE
ncbi:FeoA domain protein [Subdoligranulum variabile DSM 15176]|uniref:FeoA domain protein n=2 Tax=Subdoligranulum variabile TaxID=214851 RepID=D1PII0_9FIRM|nr:FeoA domain protein [Subdoligranulum variabile DSM 15176]